MEKNIERACVILKLHELYPDDESLKYRQVEEYLFKIDKKCGDSFVYEEANSNSRFEGIGAYLMKDSTRGYTIRAGSTTTSFAQRFKEHLKCSKLRNDTDRDSILYSSYPHTDKKLLIDKSKGEWRNIDNYAIIGWDKGKTKDLIDLFEWDDVTMSGLRNNKNVIVMQKKQERMMAYLFELLLQLSLDPKHKISSNPGFETFNGTLAKK